MIKAILRKTPLKRAWDKYKYIRSDFYRFESGIPDETRKTSRKVISWADNSIKQIEKIEAEENYLNSEDPVIREYCKLSSNLRKQYENSFSESRLRVLVHVPDELKSPGGYSLFINLIESASYLGFNVKALNWNDSTESILEEFQPNVLLTSDSTDWLERIDWSAVERYRQRTGNLKVGLTASLEEEYNTPLIGRLKWAKSHGVNFYYCYDSPEYLNQRKESYASFFNEGYQIYSYEYTFNPLRFYPIPGIARDLNYVFLGSGYKHRSKEKQYIEFFSKPLSSVSGFIYGPKWRGIPYYGIDANRDRYIYARGKVGLNLSIGRQMAWPSVLNERTYMLAACGIPQLTDRPLLLAQRFSDDELFIADSPEEYSELFFYILSHPEEATDRALRGMRRVFMCHTNYHRCADFFSSIEKEINM